MTRSKQNDLLVIFDLVRHGSCFVMKEWGRLGKAGELTNLNNSAGALCLARIVLESERRMIIPSQREFGLLCPDRSECALSDIVDLQSYIHTRI